MQNGWKLIDTKLFYYYRYSSRTNRNCWGKTTTVSVTGLNSVLWTQKSAIPILAFKQLWEQSCNLWISMDVFDTIWVNHIVLPNQPHWKAVDTSKLHFYIFRSPVLKLFSFLYPKEKFKVCIFLLPLLQMICIDSENTLYKLMTTQSGYFCFGC